jgi:hypothetical protein
LVVVGHGAGGSYAEIDEALLEADDIGHRMNATCQAGASSLSEELFSTSKSTLGVPQKWCVVFGGDIASQERPSVGNVVQHLQSQWGAAVLAVQSKHVQASSGVDSFCSAVHWYDKVPNSDGSAVFGGTNSGGEPVAATRIYLGHRLLPHIAGIAAFGGGKIACAEVAYALRIGLPLKYTPCAPRTHPSGPDAHPFGATHKFLMDMGISEALTLPSPASAAGCEAERGSLEAVRQQLEGLGASAYKATPPPVTPPRPLEDTHTCMTMHQPWASLMVYGIKRAEGRVWTPSPSFTVSTASSWPSGLLSHQIRFTAFDIPSACAHFVSGLHAVLLLHRVVSGFTLVGRCLRQIA